MNVFDSIENNTFFKNSGKRIGQSSLYQSFQARFKERQGPGDTDKK
jgi:hypothetical protein